uniref:OTU domain-containing protein n=1 Tax=Strigamia maritima TaxID=126957 RepID=T1IS17_STRMM
MAILAAYAGRTTPPKGWPPPCSREEKRPSGSAGFDEFDSIETGPSHSKRRHRASPHRSLRNKHRGSNVVCSSSSACLNLPSTSGNNCKSGNNTPANSGDGGAQSEDYSGYNSGDEYMTPPNLWLTEEEWVEREKTFEKKMRKKGFLIKKMGEDGACLFRAVGK